MPHPGLRRVKVEYLKDPRKIEELSMSIIAERLRDCNFTAGEWAVVRRVVHTTGDVSFAGLLQFRPGAPEAGAHALTAAGRLWCDVEMVKAGINRRAPISVSCRIHEPEVAEKASRTGTTRAAAAMMAAVEEQPDGGIFVIGNAPTALFALLEAAAAGRCRPALVVGTPVGFVGAAESKEWLTGFDFPWISVRGEKGGSTVAAAIVNAILKLKL
jgi:precorrin-8X/cobalt-precorrin-8 methylmutase